eukprot:gene14212-20182_t
MLLTSLRALRCCRCAAGEGVSAIPLSADYDSSAAAQTSLASATSTPRAQNRAQARNWVKVAARELRQQRKINDRVAKTLERRLSRNASASPTEEGELALGDRAQSWEDDILLHVMLNRTLKKKQRSLKDDLTSVDVVVDRLEAMASALGTDMDQAAQIARLEGHVLLEPPSMLLSKLQLLETLLGGLARNEALAMVEKCPMLLMSTTIRDISALFKSRGLYLTDMAMQQPDLLLQDVGSLRHKLDSLPAAVELSSANAMDILIKELCNLPRNFLSELIFQEPEVLCFSPITLQAKFEALMRKYGSFQLFVPLFVWLFVPLVPLVVWWSSPWSPWWSGVRHPGPPGGLVFVTLVPLVVWCSSPWSPWWSGVRHPGPPGGLVFVTLVPLVVWCSSPWSPWWSGGRHPGPPGGLVVVTLVPLVVWCPSPWFLWWSGVSHPGPPGGLVFVSLVPLDDVVDMILVDPRVLVDAQPLDPTTTSSMSSLGSLYSFDDWQGYADRSALNRTGQGAATASMDWLSGGGGSMRSQGSMNSMSSMDQPYRSAGQRDWSDGYTSMDSVPRGGRQYRRSAVGGGNPDARGYKQQQQQQRSMSSMGSMNSMSSIDSGLAWIGNTSGSGVGKVTPTATIPVREKRTSVVDRLIKISSQLDAPLSELVGLMKAVAAQGNASAKQSNNSTSSKGSSSSSLLSSPSVRLSFVSSLGRQVYALAKVLGVSVPEARRLATTAPSLLGLTAQELESRAQAISQVLSGGALPASVLSGAAQGGPSPSASLSPAPSSMAGGVGTAGPASQTLISYLPELLLMDAEEVAAALKLLETELRVSPSEAREIAAAHPSVLLQLANGSAELQEKLSTLQLLLGLPVGVVAELMVKEPRLLLLPAAKLQAGLDKLSGGLNSFGSADAMDMVLADPTVLLRAAEEKLKGSEVNGEASASSDGMAGMKSSRNKVKPSRRKRAAAEAAAAAAVKLQPQKEPRRKKGGQSSTEGPAQFPSPGYSG